MRYWLWYKNTGEIGGEAIIAGGWDDSFDFNDPDTLGETALTVRAQLIAVEGFHSFVSYDCPCDPSEVWCQCSTLRCADSCVMGEAMMTKPSFDIVLDDGVIANLSQVDATPGADVNLRLEGAVPDGVVVQAHNAKMAEVLQASPTNRLLTAWFLVRVQAPEFC